MRVSGRAILTLSLWSGFWPARSRQHHFLSLTHAHAIAPLALGFVHGAIGVVDQERRFHPRIGDDGGAPGGYRNNVEGAAMMRDAPAAHCIRNVLRDLEG